MRREWIEITPSMYQLNTYQSPSMRREWIVIPTIETKKLINPVSLHAEGVD